MMANSVNVKVLNDFDRELVKVVAAVLIDPATGAPYKVTGGGGGGGGDTDLTPVTDLIGTLVASPDAYTQLGRLKTLADLLVAQTNNMASQHTDNQADLDALITLFGTNNTLLTTLDSDLVSRVGEVTASPAANTILARLLNIVTSTNTVNTTLSTLLAAIRDSVKVPQFSAVSVLNITTPLSAGTYNVFGTSACTALDIVNDTGVDIEYRRNAAGLAFPVLAGTSRLVTGITNANQIGVRRVDQVLTAVTVKAEAFVL